jgi:hypothetical protein
MEYNEYHREHMVVDRVEGAMDKDYAYTRIWLGSKYNEWYRSHVSIAVQQNSALRPGDEVELVLNVVKKV